MVVVDSSAAVDYLLGLAPRAAWVERQLEAAAWRLRAPHLLDIEVVSVVRRFVLTGLITADHGAAVIDTLAAMRVRRYPHVQLLPRIWELRHNVAPRDAAFVALAEALRAPLLTTDERLARAPGLGAEVIAP